MVGIIIYYLCSWGVYFINKRLSNSNFSGGVRKMARIAGVDFTQREKGRNWIDLSLVLEELAKES